jgi:hypothetical protein
MFPEAPFLHGHRFGSSVLDQMAVESRGIRHAHSRSPTQVFDSQAFQQQLHLVTREERADWREEEAGLVDALAAEIGLPSCEENTSLSLRAINAVSRVGKPSPASALPLPLAWLVWRARPRSRPG